MGVKCILEERSKLKIPLQWLADVIREHFDETPKGAEFLFRKTDGYVVCFNTFETIEVCWSKRTEIER